MRKWRVVTEDGRPVARFDGRRLELGDPKAALADPELGVAYRLVVNLVGLGVPVERSDPGVRYDFWRVQVTDGDYVEALRDFLEHRNPGLRLKVEAVK